MGVRAAFIVRPVSHAAYYVARPNVSANRRVSDAQVRAEVETIDAIDV
jgi:hypothetical protein